MRTSGMSDEMFEPNERDSGLMSRPVGQKKARRYGLWDDVG